MLCLVDWTTGKLTARAEVAIVGDDNKFRILTSSEVSDYLEEVE